MEVWVVGEGIRSHQEVVQDMDDLQIEICKAEQPSHLATIEVLCLTEVHQVLVVCEHLDRKERSVEIVSP